MVENTHALRSIRMEGLQQFCKQNKEFCVQKERMDGKLSQTKLSSFAVLSIFDLVSCFPLFLVLGSNAKIQAFPNLEIFGKIHVVTLM